MSIDVLISTKSFSPSIAVKEAVHKQSLEQVISDLEVGIEGLKRELSLLTFLWLSLVKGE